MAKLNFSGKTSDMCSFEIIGDDGTTLFENEGNIPALGIGESDYVRFSIDLETGRIEHWQAISAEDAVTAVRAALGIYEEEE